MLYFHWHNKGILGHDKQILFMKRVMLSRWAKLKHNKEAWVDIGTFSCYQLSDFFISLECFLTVNSHNFTRRNFNTHFNLEKYILNRFLLNFVILFVLNKPEKKLNFPKSKTFINSNYVKFSLVCQTKEVWVMIIRYLVFKKIIFLWLTVTEYQRKL